jgi:hypothetical protein
MGNERARQKKLAKHKKKRAAASKRSASTNRLARDPGLELGRIAASWPVEGVWVGANWNDTESPALVSGVLVRRGSLGDLAAGVVLVDRTCLGLKSGSVRRISRERLETLLDQIGDMHEGVTSVDLLTLQSIVFHGVDYAQRLGFAPDRDFPMEFMGPRPEALLDTPYANVPKPRYLAGPRDDQAGIVAKLASAVGVGNFDYIASVGSMFEFGDAFDGEAFDGDVIDGDVIDGEAIDDGDDEPDALP